MHIYVMGDSFTIGDELADSDIFPGWPGYRKFGDNEATAKASKWFQDVRSKQVAKFSYIDHLDLLEKGKAKSWPTILGRLTTAKVTNAGQSGSSQSSMTYRTMMDIEKILASGETIDKVFIMVTSHLRTEVYGEMWGFSSTYGVSSLLPQIAQHEQNKEFGKLSLQWDKAEPDYGKAARYLAQIILIREYVKSKLGFEPIFLDSAFLHIMTLDFKDVPEPFNSELSRLIERSKLFNNNGNYWKVAIDRMQDVISATDTQTHCPNYHLSPMVHQRFAEHLYNKYFKEQK
jgi:hypothetical protein